MFLAGKPAEAEWLESCAPSDPKSGAFLQQAINPPDPALVIQLIGWIADHLDYDMSRLKPAPPTIRFCVVGETIHYEGRDLLVEDNLRAAYDRSARVIQLVAPWDADKLEDQSVLLHELIHDVQLQSRTWDCPQQPEYEAYQMQAEWLQEHGLAVPFDLAQIFIRSRCPRPHP